METVKLDRARLSRAIVAARPSANDRLIIQLAGLTWAQMGEELRAVRDEHGNIRYDPEAFWVPLWSVKIFREANMARAQIVNVRLAERAECAS